MLLLLAPCLRLQAALLKIAKPSNELVRVDLEGRIKELGLDNVYPVSWWPPMAAVRELATKVKNLKKAAPERMEEPFAHCDLRKYVLHAAPGLHFSLCLSGSCPPSARMLSRSS